MPPLSFTPMQSIPTGSTIVASQLPYVLTKVEIAGFEKFRSEISPALMGLMGNHKANFWNVGGSDYFIKAMGPIADEPFRDGACQRLYGIIYEAGRCIENAPRGEAYKNDFKVRMQRDFPHELYVKMYLDGNVGFQNKSVFRNVFIGGARLEPNSEVTVMLDGAFLMALDEQLEKTSGQFLVFPKGMMKAAEPEVIVSPRQEAPKVQPDEKLGGNKLMRAISFVFQNLLPARENDEKNIPVVSKPMPRELLLNGVKIVTPKQVRDVRDLKSRSAVKMPDAAMREVRSDVRSRVSGGGEAIGEKGSYLPLRGDEELLDAVRSGGMLLPTHAAPVSAALGILNSGRLDPAMSPKKKVFLRYGFGHSYGEIVFVFRPQKEMRLKVTDIWGQLKLFPSHKDGLYSLAKKVNFNRHVRVKAQPSESFHGRSVVFNDDNYDEVMEMMPQFESDSSVSVDDVLAVLVPEHLYGRVSEGVSEKYKDLLIKISGTGRDEREFLEGREDVARRSRKYHGRFQPVFGKSSLHLFERAYFSLVEGVQVSRHIAIKRQLEALAIRAIRGPVDHDAILDSLAAVVAAQPEAFDVLDQREQFTAHDGMSPLAHTLNAIIEAVNITPPLVKEHPTLRVADVYIALLLHDIGKISGAKSRQHGDLSLEMAEFHLKMMGFGIKGESPRSKFIRRLIATSDLLNEASKERAEGKPLQQILPELVEQAGSDLPEIFLVNYSDVSSIPGRSGRTMKAVKGYEGKVLDVRPRIVELFEKAAEYQK